MFDRSFTGGDLEVCQEFVREIFIESPWITYFPIHYIVLVPQKKCREGVGVSEWEWERKREIYRKGKKGGERGEVETIWKLQRERIEAVGGRMVHFESSMENKLDFPSAGRGESARDFAKCFLLHR